MEPDRESMSLLWATHYYYYLPVFCLETVFVYLKTAQGIRKTNNTVVEWAPMKELISWYILSRMAESRAGQSS